MPIIAFIIALLCVAGSTQAAPIHTTYLWHLEQPIYWPAPSTWGLGYETAWESITHKNAGATHPQNDVTQIFSLDDRVAAYQFRPRDAIAAMTGADAGAQVTYSGGLLRNVASLGAGNHLGYTPSWNTPFQTARSWNTSGGRPRMELTIIPYHHALAPLVDKAVLEKEIAIYQYAYPYVWGSTPAQSTGFFPPELAFSERIIPILAEKGITWTFVPSNHLSRACQGFPLVLGTGGENCDPPNPADQINPSSANWFSMTISRGCTPKDAVPFSFQAHRAQYIDPQTGTAAQVIVVPVAMAMSWQDGYQTYGIGDINSIAALNDPAHPMLITLGHDGDNAFGGGYSYYMESVPSFTSQAVSAGYEPSTVPEFLADHPPLSTDLVHVEDGAWVNADGDFGSPDFINWNWPLYNSSGHFDIPNGWALDERNWAVITAATNRVVTAEAVAGTVHIGAIQDPTVNPPQPQDLAWHFLLGSLNSGYMYYGNTMDMEIKPTVACNAAVSYANQIINGAGDPVPPTIWAVQQLPHNPGGTGFGSLYGYINTPQPRDFYVWSFIYDVSGVQTVTFYYRLDHDGTNPISSIQNETFTGGAEVTSWRARSMTRRIFPAGNVYNEGDVNFEVMPTYIADEYFYHLQESEVVDSGNVLVDYYIEAIDSLGNISRSDIYHTFVGTGQGTTPGDHVTWTPQNPQAGQTLTISYSMTGSPLPAGTNPVYIHIGHSGWQGIITPDPQMTYNSTEEVWKYTYAIPSGATMVDFVFRDGSNNWDNNSGADWHVTVTGGGSSGFVMDGTRDAASVVVATGDGITLWAGWNGAELYLATERAQGSAQDRFLYVAAPPGALQTAPWAKAGQIAAWGAYLAEESSNGWKGWFDAQGSTGSAASAVLEGTIRLDGEFGAVPDYVYLCAARYATADGGALFAQAPAAVIANGNIEVSEYLKLALKPDSLTIRNVGSSVSLKWTAVIGAAEYIVYRASTFEAEPQEIGRTALTTYTDPISLDRGFYFVKARY